MLNDREIAHTYREYNREPLSEVEIREVLRRLGLSAREVLRTRDARAVGIPDDAAEDALITAMASHPKLLQRPILVHGERAVLGRPVENLTSLLP